MSMGNWAEHSSILLLPHPRTLPLSLIPKVVESAWHRKWLHQQRLLLLRELGNSNINSNDPLVIDELGHMTKGLSRPENMANGTICLSKECRIRSFM